MTNSKSSHYYTRPLFQFCFTVFWVLTLGGCSTFDESTQPLSAEGASIEERNAESVAVKPKALSIEQMPDTSDVEVLWAVPDEPVDRFILRYGSNKESLEKEISLTPLQLTTVISPQHGKAFRYLITGIPKDQILFLTLASAKGEEISKPTEVFEIRGEE